MSANPVPAVMVVVNVDVDFKRVGLFGSKAAQAEEDCEQQDETMFHRIQCEFVDGGNADRIHADLKS